MSDLHSVREKVSEGADWRGTISVEIDGEEYDLTVRQLRDPEFYEVMSMVDRSELQEMQEELPDDKMDEYQELQSMEERSEEEEERMEELQSELENSDADFFTVLSEDTFEGIRQAAKYAVVPDEEDLQEVFQNRARAVEQEYGVKVQTPEDVRPAVEDEIESMLDESTDFVSFVIGMKALLESVGEDEGNSEN